MRARILTLLACACDAPSPHASTPEPDPGALVVDPRVLYREGQRARDRGDDVTAGRWFARARVAAEHAHGKLAVATGRRMTPQMWSPDGRWVVFERADGAGVRGEAPSVQVVDSKTGTSFAIEGTPSLMFARDGRTLVVRQEDLFALDLETRAERMPRRPAAAAEAKLAPDGRLVWVESGDGAHRVFARDLATGREVVLEAPAPKGGEVEHLGFGARGEIVAWTTGNGADQPGFAHVWHRDRATPVASIADLGDQAPIVEDGLLVYGAVAAHDLSRLQFVELDQPGAKVQRLPARGACGAGTLDYHLERCAPRVFAVDGERLHACMWDLQRRRVVDSTPTEGQEISCSATKLHLFFGGPPEEESGERGPVSANEDGSLSVGKVALVDSAGTTGEQPDEAVTRVAGVSRERAGRVWSAETGKLLWQSTKPSQARAIAFAPSGRRLAIVGGDGTGWHLDLATGELTGSPGPDGCTMEGDRIELPIAVDRDGRIVRYCSVARQNKPDGMEVWIDGERRAVTTTESYATQPILATTAWAGTAAIIDRNRLRAWSLPTGKVRPGLAALPDAASYVAIGITAAGDRIAIANQHTLELWDAHGNRLWTRSVIPDAGSQIRFSADGKLLASASRYSGTEIIVTANGETLDRMSTRDRAVAFDPSARRIAYWAGVRLVVRHLGSGIEQEHDWDHDSGRHVSIAWSADGQLVAALVGDVVALWRVGWRAPLATIHVAGRGGVAIREDGRLHLLGDPRAARALVACRFGDELFPFAACEDRLVRSDSLATAFVP